MDGHAEHAPRGGLHRREGVSRRASDAACARDPDEPHLEDARLDASRLDGLAGAVELPAEEVARAREAVRDVRDPLAGDTRDDGDAADGAVRAALLRDGRALRPLLNRERGAAEGEEEGDQRRWRRRV